MVIYSPEDPGTIIETEDIEEFLAAIVALSAFGGGDTPEPSIGATIRALKASKQGSSIFVFTDASASDENRANEAISLIVEKDIRVNFALVSGSIGKRSINNEQQYEFKTAKRQASVDVYGQIAALSGGQILNIQTNDISELASLVSFSAIPSRRTIFRRSSDLVGSVEHSFPIDSSIVQVIISATGQSITISLRTPQG